MLVDLPSDTVTRPSGAMRRATLDAPVGDAWGTAFDLPRALADRGVLVFDTGPTRGRLVTHLDVDGAGVAHALHALTELYR